MRQNALFGATVIKICVDCKPWGYSVDDIRPFISEVAQAGLKVEGHVQTVDGARRAIEAGIWSIAHGSSLTDEMHKLMAQIRNLACRNRDAADAGGAHHRGPLRANGCRPAERVREQRSPHVLDRRGLLHPCMTRGEVAIEFIETWKAAGIPKRRHP